MSRFSGSGTAFSAHLPAETGNDPEAWPMLEHYGQDLDSDWFLSRFAFPWRDRQPKMIESLTLTMIQEPGQVPGPQFSVAKSGETVQFTNPVTGTAYMLTVCLLYTSNDGAEHGTVDDVHFEPVRLFKFRQAGNEFFVFWLGLPDHFPGSRFVVAQNRCV